MASGNDGESIAKEPSAGDAAEAAVEASVAERDSVLEIESLSQGTLEPVEVDRESAASSEEAPDEPPVAEAAVPAPQATAVSATEGDTANILEVSSTDADTKISQGNAASLQSAAETTTSAVPDTPRKIVPATEPSSHRSTRRTALFLGMGALVAMGAAVFALRPDSPSSSNAMASSEPSAEPPAAAAPVVESSNAAQANHEGTAAATVAVPSEPSSEDTFRVAINITTEGARVFYRGKEVGRTPFTLELLRGERRVFEVGYPGYATRRLIIDGSDKEISFSLTQDTK